MTEDEAERHRRARAKKVTAKRSKFRKDLTAFFKRVETENPLEGVMELGMGVEDRVREASRDPDRRRAAHTILQIEREATESLRRLESSYRVSKPRVGITRAQEREWRNYQEVFEDISGSIRDIRDSIDSVVTDEVTKSGVDVSVRARVESALDDMARLARKETRRGRKDVDKAAEEVLADTRRVATRCVRDVDSAIREVMAEFARRDLTNLDDEALAAERSALGGSDPGSSGKIFQDPRLSPLPNGGH